MTSANEYIIRHGRTLTMDPTLGDFAACDLHIRAGEIVAVAPRLPGQGLPIIDATGMIVMPGFVDTHWHLWESNLRGKLRGGEPDANYFTVTAHYGPLHQPDDNAGAVRFGAAQALLSGITTVHNWAHNLISVAHAEAELDALDTSGLRARFSIGPGKSQRPDEFMDLSAVPGLIRDHRSTHLDFGIALRTPGAGGYSIDSFAAEVKAARDLGLPISVHTGAKGIVTQIASRRLFGADILLAHPQGLTPDELGRVGDSGARYSIAPVIELSYSAARNGVIQFAELQQRNVPIGLSVDSAAACGVDYFAVMRALLWSNWQRTGVAVPLKPRDIVEIATLGGAGVLGLEDRIGSLSPGKRADIILVRAGDPNLAPVEDPYYSLVFSGRASNVDTVIVDGEVLVFGGRMQRLDVEALVAEAKASIARLDAHPQNSS